MGDAPGMARVKANLFVNTWLARADEGLKHIGRVFRYLKEIVPLSCESRNVGLSSTRRGA